MPAPHWADLAEAGSTLGLRLLYGAHRLGGRPLFRLLALPVLCWYLLMRPVARRASLEYLQHLQAHGGKTMPAPNWLNALRHQMSFAEAVLDKLLAIGGRYDPSLVEIHGEHHLQAHIDAGRGVLLITAHLGNLELCRARGAATSLPGITVLVHTRHAQRFNRMLSRLDPHSRVELLQVTEFTPATAVLLAERIAAGGVVVIAGDRVPVEGGRVTFARFLGRQAAWPIGPYLLGALLRCPTLLMFSPRRPEGGYRVHFEPFREQIVLPRGAREAVFAELAQAYADRLTAYCQQSPFEWFNFFPFWDQVVSVDER